VYIFVLTVLDEDAVEIVNEEEFLRVKVNQEDNETEAEAVDKPDMLLAQVEANKGIGGVAKGKHK